MKTIIKIILFFLIILTLSCKSNSDKTDNNYYNQNDIQPNLENKIISEFKISQNEEELILEINKITKFEWDKLYIFTPYTPNDEIIKILKVKNKNKLNTGIEMFDNFNCLIFLNNNKIIKILDLDRPYSDYILENGLKINNKIYNWRKVSENSFGYILDFL